jgi:hypothetical protein
VFSAALVEAEDSAVGQYTHVGILALHLRTLSAVGLASANRLWLQNNDHNDFDRRLLPSIGFCG